MSFLMQKGFFVSLVEKKVRLLVEIFRLVEKINLKRLFSIGSQSCRKLTKNNVGVVLLVTVLIQKEFLDSVV